ncbi:MAG: acetoacetate--CoA ligase [Acidobacteriota bacterium]
MAQPEASPTPAGESEILWAPSRRRIDSSNMTRFRRRIEQQTGQPLSSYQNLHAWSIESPGEFWREVLDFCSIRRSGSSSPELTSLEMPGARWFPNLRVDFTRNLLESDFSGPAIIAAREDSKAPREVSADQLRSHVSAAAHALRNLGIKDGDRVAGYLANVPEAIVACLGSAAAGAIWSSTSPDFGLKALVDRLSQIRPRVVFTSSGYHYGGRQFSTDDVVRNLKGQVPSIETIVNVGPARTSPADMIWEDFLESGSGSDWPIMERPFNHPLYILFSSGTTGKPKCLVHGAGGTLIQHLKELSLHCDLKPGSRLLFFTTCGWMMWNWQLSALALGATLCLYDGHPGYPALDRLWQVARDLEVTHLGTSGRYIEACMRKDGRRVRAGGRLKTVLYTGSPLSPDGFRWVYESVGDDIHLAGISGGTDIVSCFVLGNPNLPVRAGEIQCKGLGADVVALDESGREIVDRPGELVCKRPLPSMPLEFLDDPDGAKYRRAYFEKYPGLWTHGDFIEFRSGSGGIVIYGRSDATLNPGGVRIGAAEIYGALTRVPELTGALVTGWTPPGRSDEVIVLAVTVREPHPTPSAAPSELANRIRTTLKEACSPRHVPREIFIVGGIPVTRSGKVVELTAKAILAGHEVTNREVLADPTLLEEFSRIRHRLLEKYGSNSSD